jgi:hypothetical protein
MTDGDHVQRWLDAYTQAWLSYDPAAIGALFSDDAQYRWHPWDSGDEVACGRDGIVAAWLDDRDTAGTYTGEYRPLLIAGDDVIATGVSRYYADPEHTVLETEFHNLWVLHFDSDGRCDSFTEWFMKAPKNDKA